MRFPAMVIGRVREAVGPGYPVMVKMNVTDGIKGGLEIDDAIVIAERFEAEGASALVPSCGFTSKTPLMMLRGNVPTMEMVAVQRSYIKKAGLFLFGRFMVQRYQYSDLFLLSHARKILEAVKIPVVLIGGICSIDNLDTAMREGFEFVEIGRALIKDPDIVNKWYRGDEITSACDHCNRCIAEMDRGGVACVSNARGLLIQKQKGLRSD